MNKHSQLSTESQICSVVSQEADILKDNFSHSQEESISIRIKEGLEFFFPDTLQSLSTFAYLEQENWFEKELMLIQQYLKPGMIALDIGSCFGGYALPMAALVGERGKVVAFEPNRVSCRYLEKSKKANKLNSLSVINKAVTDFSKACIINEAKSPEFAKINFVPDSRRQEVESVSLDNWWKMIGCPNVDLVKVDVNGQESIVINGAKKLLSETSALIVFAATSLDSCIFKDYQRYTNISIKMLKKLGYSIYSYLPELNVLSDYDDTQYLDPYQINLVACKSDLAAFLKESGLMVTNLDSLPKVDNDSWYSHLSNFSFSKSILDQWKKNFFGKENAYMAAFNFLCAAQDKSCYSASQKFILLRIALQLFSSIYNENKISGSLSFSLARVCVELGQKCTALNILQQLKESIVSNKGADFSLPFLTPVKKFDTSHVKDSLENWVVASYVESMLHLRYPSSFFFDENALELNRMLLNNPERSIKAKRRLNLYVSKINQEENVGRVLDNKIPVLTYVMLSMSYRSQNKLTIAENIVQAGLSKYPDDLMLVEEVAEIAYAREDWNQAALLFADICRKSEEKASPRLFTRLRNAIDHTTDKENRNDIWKSTCSKRGQKAELSSSKLVNGNYEESLEIFSSLVEEIFNDDKTRRLWIDSFKCLQDCIRKDFLSLGCKEKYSKEIFPYKKVIVSGMGWSGSGAIYDYFREFRSVFPIPDELKFIQSDPGLYSLWKKSNNVDLFNKELLSFFNLCLMGFGAYRNWQSAIAAFFARSMSLSRKHLLYARGINRFCREAKKSYVDHVFDKNKFRNMANIIWDTVASFKGANKSNIVLFDNIIHTWKIEAIDFLSNTHVFCSFRDPRSNYVALLQESPLFVDTVNVYVERHKRHRVLFDKIYNSLNNQDSVTAVQFEKFILSEKYRTQLANKVRLNFSEQKKYSYFQPWISEKNVFLHESYENQDEIRIIEKALPEYCIDIHRIKREEN